MRKEKLELSKMGPDRLCVYGGAVDLVNGSSLTNEGLRQLKFSALFFKHIVVPDGFFHCYGPLYTHFAHIMDRTKAAQEADPLVRLLRAGVLVPALRRGESLYANWDRGEDVGVVPGEYLILKREDGGPMLRLVDEYTSRFAHWPPELLPDTTIRYWTAVQRVLLSPESPYTITLRDPPSELPFTQHVEWRACQALLDDFEQYIHDNEANPHFRRGDVERLVARHLGVPFESYQEAINLVDWRDPLRTPLPSLGYYLLSVSSTAYEAFQARALRTVGGLFPLHDHPFIDQGIHNALVDMSVIDESNVQQDLVFGSFDVDKLSVEDILKFRREARTSDGELLFERYCELLSTLTSPRDGQRFQDANPTYITFLCQEFVPRLISIFPHLGLIRVGTEVAGDAATLLGIGVAKGMESISFAGWPLAAILTGSGVLLRRSAPYIQSLAEYIRAKQAVWRFGRNNYALWRQRT